MKTPNTAEDSFEKHWESCDVAQKDGPSKNIEYNKIYAKYHYISGKLDGLNYMSDTSRGFSALVKATATAIIIVILMLLIYGNIAYIGQFIKDM